MTRPNQSELEELLVIEYGFDPQDLIFKKLVSDLMLFITAHTNAEIAKAKLEAFDVAFDCHDYDRLRAYRAKLLKETEL